MASDLFNKFCLEKRIIHLRFVFGGYVSEKESQGEVVTWDKLERWWKLPVVAVMNVKERGNGV